MKLGDKYSQTYNIKFDGENTLIANSKKDLMTTAPLYLEKLSSEGKVIYVTDPYLFPNFKSNQAMEEANYENNLLKLLEDTKATEVIFCAKEKKNDALYTKIEMELKKKNIKLSFDTRLEECHDRFWYCPETEKCVVFGTSLNGIGKKICYITELESNDVKELRACFVDAGILSDDEE